jgi:uncharacterized glyoxalase superfamily metalloenzyme YdcJ
MSTPNSQLVPFVDVVSLRTKFALAMSAMYKAEVPLYGDLIRIVAEVNEWALIKADRELEDLELDASYERLSLERHGAIRLGTPYELQQVRRIFALLGMQSVGYYDLSVAGIPMHATCFRPVEMVSLERNPFRVFTTLLRPELIKSDHVHALAADLLVKRRIFSDRLLELLQVGEDQGGRLTAAQSETFISEALHTFGWKPVAGDPDCWMLSSKTNKMTRLPLFRSYPSATPVPRTSESVAAKTIPSRQFLPQNLSLELYISYMRGGTSHVILGIYFRARSSSSEND